VTTITEGAMLGMPAAQAWELLHDQAMLAAALPGCDQLEATGPGTGHFTITPDLAPVGGTYSGSYTVTEEVAPLSLVLSVEGAGDRGAFEIDVTVRLAGSDEASDEASAEEATLVSYDVRGSFSGSVAGAGQRLLASIMSRLASELFAALDAAGSAPEPPSEAGSRRQKRLVLPIRVRAVEREDDSGLAALAGRPEVRVAFAIGVAIGLAVVIAAGVRRRGRR